MHVSKVPSIDPCTLDRSLGMLALSRVFNTRIGMASWGSIAPNSNPAKIYFTFNLYVPQTISNGSIVLLCYG